MDKNIKDALISFMRLTLYQLHPNLDEYPFEDVENIDTTEGDESPKLNNLPEYIVTAYYMQKAIKILEST